MLNRKLSLIVSRGTKYTSPLKWGDAILKYHNDIFIKLNDCQWSTFLRLNKWLRFQTASRSRLN